MYPFTKSLLSIYIHVFVFLKKIRTYIHLFYPLITKPSINLKLLHLALSHLKEFLSFITCMELQTIIYIPVSSTSIESALDLISCLCLSVLNLNPHFIFLPVYLHGPSILNQHVCLFLSVRNLSPRCLPVMTVCS